MKPQSITQYDAPHRFEPLLPADSVMGPLLERSSDLIRAATALGHTARPSAQLELRKLLRSMNSCYSNRIEGEHTRPSDIERALQQDFSAQTDLARKQRLAVAHIRTEAVCEADIDRRRAQGEEADAAARWLYTPEALTWCGVRRLMEQIKPMDSGSGQGANHSDTGRYRADLQRSHDSEDAVLCSR